MTDLTFAMPDVNVSGKEDSEFPISPLCMTVPYGETMVVFIGTLDRQVYRRNLHTNQAIQSDMRGTRKQKDIFSGHDGPVSCLSSNINFVRPNCSTNGLMLSGSFDWGIKMWNAKACQENLFDFEYHKDYVTDVQWNPVHPGCFISTDVDGTTAVWNMFHDREKPSVAHKNSAGNLKARWNFNGRHFAIGDMKGDISVSKLRASDIEYDEENLVEFVNLMTDLSHGRGNFFFLTK
jgi:WD40 repeat protein